MRSICVLLLMMPARFLVAATESNWVDQKEGGVKIRQTDSVCSIPLFRKCYSDFLQNFGIDSVTEDYNHKAEIIFSNRNAGRSQLEKVHSYFVSLDSCLSTNKLENCINTATFKALGMNETMAASAAGNYYVYQYSCVTEYQVYYENYNCINSLWHSQDLQNTSIGIACWNASIAVNNHQTCSLYDKFLQACLQLWSERCQRAAGAFRCNMEYILGSIAYESEYYSNCSNVCPPVEGAAAASNKSLIITIVLVSFAFFSAS